MKIISQLIYLLCLGLCPLYAYAQCDQNIQLTTQTALNEFANNNCGIISGNLCLGDCNLTGNPSNITDLSPLQNVQHITGKLQISNTQINNLQGLEALQNIGSALLIQDNAELLKLDGLENLQNLGGQLRIERNASLYNMEALMQLTHTNGWVSIVGNASLPSLEGFQNIEFINGNLTIQNNSVLLDLDGLQKLNYINGAFYLKYNDLMMNLNGIFSLEEVDGDIVIYNNDFLRNMSALSSLKTIGKSLYIEDNDSLTTVSGLKNVEIIFEDLVVLDNRKLKQCCALLELAQADKIHGFITIYHNLETCYNINNVNASPNCNAYYDFCGASIYLRDQWTVNWVQAYDELDNLYFCNKIEGDLCIGDCNEPWDYTGINNADALYPIDSVMGDLLIYNTHLKNIDSLKNIKFVGGNVEIFRNDSLLNLNGLSGLQQINGNLLIRENKELKHLDGLINIDSIGGDLSISYNTSLQNINGLNSVENIGGGLWVLSNTALGNLEGLANINHLDQNVSIANNASLVDCCTLAEIANNIQGNINLQNNTPKCNALPSIATDCDIPLEQNGIDTIGTGLNEIQERFTIRVYPNPSTGIVYLKAQKALSNQSLQLKIYDLNGQLVFLHTSISTNEPIDLSMYSDGLYFITLDSGKQSHTSKILIQH